MIEAARPAVDLNDPWSLTDEIPALIAKFDGAQRYLHVNRAYQTFFGKTSAELLGRTIAEVTGPEHYRIAEPYIRRALSGERVSFTATLNHADGSPRHLSMSYSPRYGDYGQPAGFIALIQDMTERNFTAEARARLAAIVDSSDDVIVSKTLDGIITSWNRSAERVFGYSAAEAIGKHITLIIPPEKWAEEDEILARLRRGERIDHFETERRAKDGRTVHVSLTVSPVRNARGVIIGASKVARDITQRKRDEAALRSSEEYRRALVETIPECIKVLDREGQVVTMNRAGLEMLEAESSEQVIGKCVYPLIVEQDREAFRIVNESVFHGGDGGKLEFTVTSLKGTERILESNVVPLRDASGEVVGALAATRDITQSKRTQLRDAFLVRLDDATRALSDPRRITETAAQLLAEQLGVDRCAYAELDIDAGIAYIVGNYARSSPSIVGQYPLAAFGHGFVEAAKKGEVFVVKEAAAEERGGEVGSVLGDWGVAAMVAVPLVKSGPLVAQMIVHQSTPRIWRPDEVELVQIVANRCWESIERARAQRDLRASEFQFRTLADTIPNLAWMAHPDGYIFWYNRRWTEYTGKTAQEMEGWGWQDVHDPEILPTVLERWQHSVRTGEPFEMIFPLRGAGGGFRSFLTRVEPIKDWRGRVVRWFGTNTDITALQEAENREKRSRETAEVLNRVGPVLAAELNPAMLTQKITAIATQAVRAEFGAFFHSLAEAQQPSAGLPEPWKPELFAAIFEGARVIRSDASESSYLAVPVTSRSGSILGGLFFGHSKPDVFTEETETIATGIAAQAAIALDNASLFAETTGSRDALRRSYQELRRVNEDLKQFAYSASHDLREPLRMVSIYTQLLGRKLSGRLDLESQEYLVSIFKGTSRLEALIRDLLAYTKAGEAPESEDELSDASEALERALSNLTTAIEEAGAIVTAEDLRAQKPGVRVAEVHLTQVMQNIIGNAVKYRGAETPKIAVDATRQGNEWRFSVADNGIGIDNQFKEQIFGIFKRLHTSDEYSGTGIGLAICQRIVQRAGGRIWVESEPGRGSTFFFTLPAADQ